MSDKPHQKDFPEKRDAINLWWWEGWENYANNVTRWTEVHPPDWIEILEPDKPISQTFRGVTVVAPGTFPGKPAIESELDVTIPAPPKPRPNAIMRYAEFVGPETDLGTIVEGNAAKTGAEITPVAAPDGIHVHVKVAGTLSVVGGQTGKFRALYWIYWEVPAVYSPAVALLLEDEPQPGKRKLHPRKRPPKPAKPEPV